MKISWHQGPAALTGLVLFFGGLAVAQTPQIPDLTPEQQTTIDQNTNNSPDRILRQSEPLAPNDELAPLPSDRGGPADQGRLSDEIASLTLTLNDVELTGNTVYDTGNFVGLWEMQLGGEVTIGELSRIASEIQTFYRNEGYVFTRVILLDDGFSRGVAEIRVIEGMLGKVTVEESAESVGPVIDLMRRMAAGLEGVVSPHISALERVLLVMNDVPGITRATAIPRRGGADGEVGVIDIVINVERAPIAGVAFADNRQSPSAGQGLLGLSGEYSSYSSAGDTTRLTFINSFWDGLDDLTERRIFQVEHSRYVLPSGLQIFFNGLYSTTDLGDDLEPLDIESRQFEFGLAARYPIIRTRPITVNSFASFDVIETENTISGGTLSEDSLRILTVGLDGLFRDSTGFTAGEIGFRKGFSFLGGSEKGDDLLTRTGADPSGSVVFGAIERDQRLYGGFTGYVYAEGQWAFDPLVSSEQFQIGGTSFGRGFDPSEESGDRGFGVNVELRYTTTLEALDFLPVADIATSTVQAYGFFDHGRVFSAAGLDGATEELSSVGGGLRFDLPEDVFVGVELAKPMNNLERTDDDGIRGFFFVQKRF